MHRHSSGAMRSISPHRLQSATFDTAEAAAIRSNAYKHVCLAKTRQRAVLSIWPCCITLPNTTHTTVSRFAHLDILIAICARLCLGWRDRTGVALVRHETLRRLPNRRDLLAHDLDRLGQHALGGVRAFRLYAD